ncbi:MAG: hypothetical protein ACPGUD_03370 [Parashewanella sp.]
MSNSINVQKTNKTEHTETKQDKHVDPQSHEAQKFRGVFMRFEDKGEEKNSSKKIPETTKAILSKQGGICKLGHSEVSRSGDMLCFRMVNGPLMGMIMEARLDKKGITLKIYPKHEKQARVMQNIKPKLADNFAHMKKNVELNIMPVGSGY